MWYHAMTDFGADTRYWWNRSRADLVKELLIPLLSKQVVMTSRREKKSLFNFGAVSYVTIVSTSGKLVRPAAGKVPLELKNRKFVKDHNVTEEFINEIRLLQSHH